MLDLFVIIGLIVALRENAELVELEELSDVRSVIGAHATRGNRKSVQHLCCRCESQSNFTIVEHTI